MSSLSILTGRFLLGIYFLLPGIMKFTEADATLAYMQTHNIPAAEPLMYLAGVTNILGGLFLIAGRHVKLVAYAFVVYILLVNFMLHDFWTMDAESAPREMQNFIKNLGIMAGLLVFAGYAPARNLSVKNWWRSDAQINA